MEIKLMVIVVYLSGNQGVFQWWDRVKCTLRTMWVFMFLPTLESPFSSIIHFKGNSTLFAKHISSELNNMTIWFRIILNVTKCNKRKRKWGAEIKIRYSKSIKYFCGIIFSDFAMNKNLLFVIKYGDKATFSPLSFVHLSIKM